MIKKNVKKVEHFSSAKNDQMLPKIAMLSLLEKVGYTCVITVDVEAGGTVTILFAGPDGRRAQQSYPNSRGAFRVQQSAECGGIIDFRCCRSVWTSKIKDHIFSMRSD